jgi:copper homeostasis protein
MRRDIAACRDLGAAGVVVGVLDAAGDVDVARCQGLIAAAGGLPVTFHRAFDFARDPRRALEAAIALGCDRLLTSGQASTAVAGAGLIRGLVGQASDRIVVMPGAGIAPHNLGALARATGAHEFHASARRRVPAPVRAGAPALAGLVDARWETDADIVRACVQALRGG